MYISLVGRLNPPLQIFLPKRVGVYVGSAIEWCPLGLVLKEPHSLDILIDSSINVSMLYL